MHECYFVSDLHLMASRSAARRHLGAIERAARRAKTFVLGGDIFDFRWARTSNAGQAVDQAIGWLEELLAGCPACDFHFVLGNHDYHQPFIDRLDRLQRRVGNFSWHRYYVRLGASIFLHGDVADRTMDARKLAAARSRWLHHKRRGRVLNRLYDLVVFARLHKPLPRLVYPKRIVARRILAYLDDIGQGPANGVRNVYFGHIHRHLSGYRFGGVMFYNGGAPIKGLKFRIVEANITYER